MKTAIDYLQAARRSELRELKRLTTTAELVHAVGELVHGLQRERGLANWFLAFSKWIPATTLVARHETDMPAADPHRAWLNQCAECARLDAPVRQRFDAATGAEPGHSTRLFAGMAYALHGMDALEELRSLIGQRLLTHQQATQAYSKLVAGLLGVVFEAADSASDPAISRLLVALFNHMQGKEWAGQERASGTVLWASGIAQPDIQQRLQHLIELQERSQRVFTEFAPTPVLQLTARPEPLRNLADLERMRRLALATPEGDKLDPRVAAHWFDCCTRHIDDLKHMEDQLTLELVSLCQQRTRLAQDELNQLLAHPRQTARLAFFESAIPVVGLDPADTVHNHPLALDRALLGMLREQSQRLQNMEAELNATRTSLNERKLIERAKGMLMVHRRLSGDDAHRFLRQTAMDQGRRLVDVADALLSLAHVLPVSEP